MWSAVFQEDRAPASDSPQLIGVYLYFHGLSYGYCLKSSVLVRLPLRRQRDYARGFPSILQDGWKTRRSPHSCLALIGRVLRQRKACMLWSTPSRCFCWPMLYTTAAIKRIAHVFLEVDQNGIVVLLNDESRLRP